MFRKENKHLSFFFSRLWISIIQMPRNWSKKISVDIECVCVWFIQTSVDRSVFVAAIAAIATADETLLPLSSDFDSLRSRRLNIAPKKPGCPKFAATGPLAAAIVFPIPPVANNSGDIPLFNAFRMPWFGCDCDCDCDWPCGCFKFQIKNGIQVSRYGRFVKRKNRKINCFYLKWLLHESNFGVITGPSTGRSIWYWHSTIQWTNTAASLWLLVSNWTIEKLGRKKQQQRNWNQWKSNGSAKMLQAFSMMNRIEGTLYKCHELCLVLHR